MKILSIIFTVLALIAAGGSGAVYFLTKGKLEEKTAELAATNASLKDSQAELGKAKTQILSTEQLLKNTRGELANAKQQTSSMSRKLVSFQTNAQNDRDAITDLEEQLETAKKDSTNLRRELLNRKNARPEDSGGASAEGVAAFKAEIEDLEKKIKLLEVQMSGGIPESYLETAAGDQPVVSQVASAGSSEELEGTIARVDAGSGIIVLAKGSSHGIQANTEYTLKKSGYVLAKVRVSKLTPDLTVATIVPNIGIPNSLRSEDQVDITR